MSFKSMLQDINTQIEDTQRSITPLKTDGWHRSSRSLRQRRHNGEQEVYVLRQSRPCSDASRWRYHGCSQRRTSSHSGGSRCVRRHGIGARARRHPCSRRRRTDERPTLIKEIKQAKARIGHFVEAQILEAVGVDYVDESEVLTLADDMNHINKHNFRIPFVCGCRNLGEALRRIREGATMIRTNGEAGTGMFLRFRIIRRT